MVRWFLVAFAAMFPQSALMREEILFDYGWRFNLGDPYSGDKDFAPMCSKTDPFPKSLDGHFCYNLQRSVSATTEAECQANCCSQLNCSTWIFREFSTPRNDTWRSGCHVGQSNDCAPSDEDWLGEQRPLPTAPPTPVQNNRASRDYDDSKWEVVNAPHDGIVGGTYSIDGPEHNGYLQQNTTWYRKHFHLPKDWYGKSIWISFDGVFRSSLIYLNGDYLDYHESGYTSFAVRLDDAERVYYGYEPTDSNVIALRADAAGGSGWWYEGGGIYRHTHLVAADPTHVVPDSVYGHISVDETTIDQRESSFGLYAMKATFHGRVEVVNDGKESVERLVRFSLSDADGNAIASKDSETFSLARGETRKIVMTNISLEEVELWSPSRPYLYHVEVSVLASGTSDVLDAVNVSTGAVSSRFDPDTGFYINKKAFTWRGFCNHNDFTGVGVAVPERVNLFRAQMMRAVGGNSWRMSHNPPAPELLDILDRLGVLVWDETRDMANNTALMADMRSMVRRDRNHPSVQLWSFCNERSCLEPGSSIGEVGAAYKAIAEEEDPFRLVTANMNVNLTTTGLPLSKVIPVQGLSHQNGDKYDSFHEMFPSKPLIGSECCSCRSQRGEDVGNASAKVFGSFNADCNQEQTLYALSRKYVSGTMVWTLFDYYGEPTPYDWPMVSSSFGSFDLAGFAKPSAFWYRAWWLDDAMASKREDVPFHPPPLINPERTMSSSSDDSGGPVVYIVQHWEPMDGEENKNRTIQVYTNAPSVELFVNDKSVGVKSVEKLGWAEWNDVAFSPGSITAYAKGTSHSDTVFTSGPPAKVIISVDVPSNETGTGTALVLDGQDAGLVRATVLDANDQVVPSASDRVMFTVLSGPGIIIGVGNGNPSCSQPNKVSYRDAYHGLARAIIQVVEDRASPPEHRRRLLEIDDDGPRSIRVIHPDDEERVPAADEIVVEAVYGVFSAQVAIPVTADLRRHGVLAVAQEWMTES